MLKKSIYEWAAVLLTVQLISHSAVADSVDAIYPLDIPEAQAEKTLNLKPCPSLEEVRSAYKRMAMIWHPDKNHDPAQRAFFTEMMTNVTSAYKILRDWLRKNNHQLNPKKEEEDKAQQPEDSEGFANRSEQNGPTDAPAAEGPTPVMREVFEPYLVSPQGLEQALREVESKMRCEAPKNPALMSQWGAYRQGSFEGRLNEMSEVLKIFHRKYGSYTFEQKYAHVQSLLWSGINMLPFYRTLKSLNLQGSQDDLKDFYAMNLANNFPNPNDPNNRFLVP